MSLTLYIDSDGHTGSTHVCVLDEDGTCLGELRHVQTLNWSLDVRAGVADVELRVLRVPGRFQADNDRVLVRMVGKRWWRRRLANFAHRLRFGRAR